MSNFDFPQGFEPSGLLRIAGRLKALKRNLPQERKPVIVVTGKLGNGKTLTIRKLRGNKVRKGRSLRQRNYDARSA